MSVFNNFDSVVCITENLINDQLSHLLAMGIIYPEIIMTQKPDLDDEKVSYEFHASPDTVPLDAHNNPRQTTLAIEIAPQIKIKNGGRTIHLIWKIKSGYAWFPTGTGPDAVLKKYNAKDWTYAVAVDLGMKPIDIKNRRNGFAIPSFIATQIHEFQSSKFNIDAVFLNFGSSEMVAFDATETNTGEADPDVKPALHQFMRNYMKHLALNDNPFILGYCVTRNDNTRTNRNLPDSLNLVGASFGLYHDPNPQNKAVNNLSLTFVAKGGYGTVTGYPDMSASNWILPKFPCDGKMIHAASGITRDLVLKPMFEKLSTSVFDKIKDSVNVNSGKTYEQALSKTATGFRFDISKQVNDSDEYINWFTADIVLSATAFKYQLRGAMRAFKKNSMDMGACTAEASAWCDCKWSGDVIISVTKGQKLKLEYSIKADPPVSDTKTNGCADAFNVFAKIGGGLLSVINFFGLNFDTAIGFKLDALEVGSPSFIFDNLDYMLNDCVMLPAGGTLVFKDTACDSSGNISTGLTYKIDYEIRAEARRFDYSFNFRKNQRKRGLDLISR
jgi:hypothetical protein